MGEVLAGRFELLDLIGHGGMGTVWRARDLRSGEVVAAKVLRQSQAADLIRFVRESAVRVRDPHVVTPLGWAGEDDRVVFAMPLVDGGSVESLVGDFGALPPVLVAELGRQLLSALVAVHAAGIVHRDVKPANLLLRATGTEKPFLLLSDFGIAAEVGGPRLTRASSVVGTPGYLAPEQLSGVDPTPAMDLYAVGVVLREMLTGVRPGSDPQGADAVDLPGSVPAPLAALVRDLSRSDPQARPASAQVALDRLRVPVLSWWDGAMGDVEVFDQLAPMEPEPARGVAEPEPARGVAEPEPAPVVGDPERARGVAEPEPSATMSVRVTPPLLTPRESPGDPRPAGAAAAPAREPGARRSSVLVPALLALTAIVGLTIALLAWHPWRQHTSAPSPTASSMPTDAPGTTRPATSTASSSSTVSSPSSSSPSDARPSSTSSESTSPGTVRTGVVVLNPGQSCSPSQLGVRETTVGGAAVVCRRTGSADPTWESAS